MLACLICADKITTARRDTALIILLGWHQNVTDIVAGCLFCTLSKIGLGIPRPLARTLNESSPNEVVHFDYLYLGVSIDNDK